MLSSPRRLLCCPNRHRYRDLRLPEMSRVLRSLVYYRCLRPASWYELERKEWERERERWAEHHRQQQEQYGHHPPYQPYPPLHSNSGTVPGMSFSMKNVNEAIERPSVCINRLKVRIAACALLSLMNVTFPGPSPVTMLGVGYSP